MFVNVLQSYCNFTEREYNCIVELFCAAYWENEERR